MKREILIEKVNMIKDFLQKYEGRTDFPINDCELINYNQWEDEYYIQYLYNVNERYTVTKEEAEHILINTILKNYGKDNLINSNISLIENELYHLVSLWDED